MTQFVDIFSENGNRPITGLNFHQLAKVRYFKSIGNQPQLHNVDNGPKVNWELYGKVLEAKNEQLIKAQKTS